jgi:hypothetical protein
LFCGGFLLAAPSPRLTGLAASANITIGFILCLVGLLSIFAFARIAQKKGRILP